MNREIANRLIDIIELITETDLDQKRSGQPGIIDPKADTDPVSELSELLICRGICPNAVNCFEAAVCELSGDFPHDFHRIFDAAGKISERIEQEA